MILTAGKVRRARGSRWRTEFEPTDIRRLFEDATPHEAFFYTSEFCLTWFVEQIFCNQQGKPLQLLPFQQVMLNMLWNKKFPMILATRGAGKTFMLAVYALLKALLVPGSKIVICGAGFRQAKLVFKYIETLYEASPLVQEAIGQWGGPKFGSDAATLRVGLSTITAIPIGDGEKIRGLRATCLIADEFASISEEIFEIVISPFTAVHANPAERAKNAAFVNRLKSLGADPRLVEMIESTQGFGNQIVISGTPGYKHNHFYKRYLVYRMFIESKGDPRKLKRAMEERAMNTTGKAAHIGDDDVRRMAKTWKQYAVYQLPYVGLPEGFLDEDVIRSDRAAFPRHRFAMEYMAQFPDDSDGFIKRSWIENSTPKLPDSVPVPIELYGDPRATYVMGVDAARWNDNMAAVVLKITERGYEVVYCEAWNRTEYEYSANKVREICNRFNIQYIAMDKGGGGDAVLEHLYMEKPGVDPRDYLWPIPDQLEEKRDLSAPGRHIVDMVNFSPAWISTAAHALEANVQQSHLMFPYKGDDSLVKMQYERHFQEAVGGIDDEGFNPIIELLQQDLWGLDEWEAEERGLQPKMGVSQQLDEMVNEVCAIVRKVTPGGTEQFDLPKLSEQPEGLDMRRRDRWSALMLANYAAKTFMGHGHKHANPAGTGTGPTRTKRGRGPNRPSVRRRGSVAY